MKLIALLVKYSRSSLVLALIASVINGASYSGLIALINIAMSNAASGAAAPRPLILWSYVGLCLLLPATRVLSETLLTKLVQEAIFDLRIDLCRQILASQLRHLEEVGAARLFAVLTEDVSALANALVQLPGFVIQLTILMGCLIYMAWLSFITFLGVVGFLGLALLSYQLLARKAEPRMERVRRDQDDLYGHIRDLTEGTKELQLNWRRRTAFITELLQPTAESYKRHNIVGNAIFSAANSWAVFLSFALMGMLLFGLPNLRGVGPSVISGYTITMLYVMIHIGVLFALPPIMSRARASLKNVDSLGLSLRGDADPAEAPPLSASAQWQSLELVGVTHSYRSEDEGAVFTLGPIHWQLHPGEVVFIIGGNGSGKTTLAKLLTGLYVPGEGEISLNDVSIDSTNREHYRQHFAVIFSDFYLFSRLLGITSDSLDLQAKEYLSKLQLSQIVQVKQGKLSTTELSRGQRKRLALLTAYLEDRPIYVFDEWAADQDPVFKSVFYCQLLPELKARGKTVVVISHDDRYYQAADRIIKLDYGRMVYDKPVTALNAGEEAYFFGQVP